MIHLNIEASDYGQLQAQLRGILYGLAEAPAKEIANPVEVKLKDNEILKQPDVIVEPEKTEPKKPRTKKTDVVVDAKVEPETKIEPEVKTDVPDIEALRAKLMELSKAEGHGTDAVFRVLEQFGAKNATTCPEDKRAEVIATINKLLSPKED